jgi:ankyrin repeat protein
MGRKRTWEWGAFAALLCVGLLGFGAVGIRSYQAHVATTALKEALDGERPDELRHPRRLRQLLRMGADPKTMGPGGFSTLTWAAYKGDAELLDYVLARGISPNGQDGTGSTALTRAVDARPPARRMVLALLAHGAQVNEPAVDGGAPLRQAAALGTLDMVKLLLAHGANVNAKSSDGRTTLMAATHNPDPEVARLLLRLGVDVHARDAEGSTALHWAAHWGTPASTRLLLSGGVEVDARDREGNTPHMVASARIRGANSIVEILLAKGANPNLTGGRTRRSALHRAVERPTELSARVAMLLRHGADPGLRSTDGHDVLAAMTATRLEHYSNPRAPTFAERQREYAAAERLLRAAQHRGQNGPSVARHSHRQ